jgi:uncharacterized protein (TIGR00725 family)
MLVHQKVPIAVVGGAKVKENATDPEAEDACETARNLGRNLASRGHYVICGGRTGVMEAVCKGCMEAGGTSICVLPENNVEQANPYCTIIIPTVLGNHKSDPERNRNSVIVVGALCVFAIAGGNGTANELALAHKHKKQISASIIPPDGWTPPEGCGKGLFKSW